MPIMVMLILPVAFTGALFALPLTGRDMSMIALVAIIMLAGTVVNSSIILVEYIKIRRGMGEDRETAILHACPLRIRPIMMTTLTTVLAMVPMALGLGESNEMMSDMGVTMISGMVISTIVTLVKNVQDGAELMANTDSFTIDADVAKIRVPYAMYDATTQD